MTKVNDNTGEDGREAGHDQDDTDLEAGAAGKGEGEGGEAGDDDGDTDDDVARAKRIGWVPESEWKGKNPPKHGFMSAKEYIARGEQLLPIAIARNATLDAKLAKADETSRALAGKLDEATRRLEEVGGVVRTLHKQNVETRKQAYERARADILAEQVRAAGEANPERVQKLQRDLDALDKGKPTDAELATDDGAGKGKGEDEAGERRTAAADDDAGKGKPKVSPAAQAWVDANPWFNASPKLNGAAIEQHDENLKAGMTEAESFEKLTEQIKEQFPERFENPARRSAPAVARPGGKSPPKKTKTFDDLPKEAKDAYREIARHDPKYTKEDYVKDYIWD